MTRPPGGTRRAATLFGVAGIAALLVAVVALLVLRRALAARYPGLGARPAAAPAAAPVRRPAG